MRMDLMKGVIDMHVHTNPDLRLRAYDDFELADAAVRVGAKAIVIKSHLGFTVNRAYLTNQYVKRVYGENTGFTMHGGVVMNKVVGGINPEAVEKGLKLGAKEIWLPTQSAKRHLEKMGQDPAKGIELVRDGKVVPELLDVFRLIKDYNVVLGTAHVSPEEAFVVIEAARDAGVKKIVVIHPEWWVVDMSMEDQIRLVKDYDVILERCYAQNMGVNIKAFRIALILLSSILSACVTAFAGPISFVGIAVPHLIKSLMKTSKPLLVIPGCFLGGAVFCLFCDLIARTAFAPTELSISSVTAVFGAPVVIYIMIRRKRMA